LIPLRAVTGTVDEIIERWRRTLMKKGSNSKVG